MIERFALKWRTPPDQVVAWFRLPFLEAPIGFEPHGGPLPRLRWTPDESAFSSETRAFETGRARVSRWLAGRSAAMSRPPHWMRFAAGRRPRLPRITRDGFISRTDTAGRAPSDAPPVTEQRPESTGQGATVIEQQPVLMPENPRIQILVSRVHVLSPAPRGPGSSRVSGTCSWAESIKGCWRIPGVREKP